MARSSDSGKVVAWRRRVGRFGRSGMAVVRFCEQEGVSTASDIEDRAKACSADERFVLRRAEATPIWVSLGEWLDSEVAARVLPKGKFGEALGYLRNHWEPLQLYLADGRMPIDNNQVEQLMKAA